MLGRSKGSGQYHYPSGFGRELWTGLWRAGTGRVSSADESCDLVHRREQADVEDRLQIWIKRISMLWLKRSQSECQLIWTHPFGTMADCVGSSENAADRPISSSSSLRTTKASCSDWLSRMWWSTTGACIPPKLWARFPRNPKWE